jgi:polyisoprenoid-binding protein YceI
MFAVRHMMKSTVRGTFSQVADDDARLDAASLEHDSVTAVVEGGSLSTGDAGRDGPATAQRPRTTTSLRRVCVVGISSHGQARRVDTLEGPDAVSAASAAGAVGPRRFSSSGGAVV